MARRPEHPAWLEYDAFAEADGLGSPAFMKMEKAARAWADSAEDWRTAFEVEFMKHHRDGAKFKKPCAHLPKYRPTRK